MAMKILFISWWFPYPPDNGARIRLFNLLRQLARRHEVVLASFTHDARDADHVPLVREFCQEVHLVPGRDFNPRSRRALAGFFSLQPRALVDMYVPQMEALVRELVAGQSFDAVIASEIGTAIKTSPYVRNLRGVPRLLEDLELSMIRGQVDGQGGVGRRLRRGLTWWKVRRYTGQLLRQVEGCTVASPKERELVAEVAPACPVEVIPNGVDVGQYEGDFGPPQPDTLIFPGSLTYRANFDAMQFFLQEVFPRLQARRDVTLRITGRTDGVPLERLPLGEGVVLTGYLDDVRPAVARSWVCVVPLREGGGTRLKILEAMALGTPVVATTKGAEGLEVTPGEHLLIADEPEDFAVAVLRLLSDEGLRARLAENGRRLVREKYDWEAIGEKFDGFLAEVVERYGGWKVRELEG